LPFPHTALVPRNKARLANNLAQFVSRNFLAPQVLLDKLQTLNPAAALGQWLAQPQNLDTATHHARHLVQAGLALLDRPEVRNALGQAIGKWARQQAQGWNAAATGASLLQLLTQGGHHHELLDGALARLKEALDTPETRQMVAQRLVAYAQKEWPTLISLVDGVYGVDKVAGPLAETLARQLVDEVQTALAQPDHAVRQRFETWLQGFVTRLGEDAAFAEQVQAFKQQWLEREDVQRYAQALWPQLHQTLANTLAEDVQQPDHSAVLNYVRQSLATLAERLTQEPGLADALNAQIETFASRAAQQFHAQATQHIAETIQAWPDAELVNQLELGIGRDLQFIRLNGTLVGGLIGLALHALSRWA
jgi:uncharacterized membrane-anchored protein YjiN (DUF445 family)